MRNEKISLIVITLDIDEEAAQSVLSLIEAEGFETLQEGLEWAKEVLASPVTSEKEEVRFDLTNLIVSDDDGEAVNPGYYTLYGKGEELFGFVD